MAKVNDDFYGRERNSSLHAPLTVTDDTADNCESPGTKVNRMILRKITQEFFPKSQSEISESVEEVEEERSCYERAFGPIGPGSMRASIFILMSNMIGVGNLALPHALLQAGLILGVIFLTTGLLLGMWSNKCLVNVAFERNVGKYSELVEVVLGKRMSRVFQFIFLFYMCGTMTNFQVVAAGFLQNVLQYIFGVPGSIINAEWEKPVQVFAINCIVYFIARAKSLHALRYVTYLTVSVLIYITIVVIVQSPSYFNKYFSADKVVYFNVNVNFMSAYAVTAFSYFCQAITLPIKSELARPAKLRVVKIIQRAHTLIWCSYMILSIVGYLCLLDHTPAIIPDRPQIGPHDYSMNVARTFLAVNLLFGIALRLNPTRLQLHILTGKPQNNFWNEVFTFILLFGSAGISILIPDVYSLMTVIGGFGAVSLAYVFPGLIYVTHYKGRGDWKVRGSWFLIIASSLMGITPTIITILQKANAIPSPST